MKHLLLINLTSLLLVFLLASPASAAWTKGSFEVHLFSVGQADSQLIVSPTSKTLLIDAGEVSWNSGRNAELIAKKIRSVMGPEYDRLDYIVVTHLDNDHVGYVGKGGVWALLEKHGFSVGKLIDRDSGVWEDKNGNGVCDDEEIAWHNIGKISGTAKNWVCYVSKLTASKKVVREMPQIGSTTQIDLGNDVVVKVIESDAKGVLMVDGKTQVSGNHNGDELPPSENDFSITLKLTFKDLDYVTGGDTDGEYNTSRNNYVYDDIESAIAEKIGEVDVMRVNHHGSSHSTNKKHLKALKPKVSLISCGKNSYGHPDQHVINRLVERSAVYITGDCDEDRDYKSSKIARGDIVLRSNDGKSYTINKDGFTSK